jgi:hypothetical protein
MSKIDSGLICTIVRAVYLKLIDITSQYWLIAECNRFDVANRTLGTASTFEILNCTTFAKHTSTVSTAPYQLISNVMTNDTVVIISGINKGYNPVIEC